MPKSLKDIIGPREGRLERYETANKKSQEDLKKQIDKRWNKIAILTRRQNLDKDKPKVESKHWKKLDAMGLHQIIHRIKDERKRENRQRILPIARARINDEKEKKYNDLMKRFRYD